MTEFIELTIDDFYQKEYFKNTHFLIQNGKYYYEISNFRKRKIKKHGKDQIFFDHVQNNKTEFKALSLNKIIYIENPMKD